MAKWLAVADALLYHLLMVVVWNTSIHAARLQGTLGFDYQFDGGAIAASKTPSGPNQEILLRCGTRCDSTSG
ncbi:MAG: hypothetical protein U0935_08035 [Pirellulales bacterium]